MNKTVDDDEKVRLFQNSESDGMRSTTGDKGINASGRITSGKLGHSDTSADLAVSPSAVRTPMSPS
jgi:hypothetical protein